MATLPCAAKFSPNEFSGETKGKCRGVKVRKEHGSLMGEMERMCMVHVMHGHLVEVKLLDRQCA